MATGLKHWIGGTIAACLLVAVAALPSGEAAPTATRPTDPGSRWGGEAARLAGAWRSSWGRWRLETYRDALSRPVDSARAAGGAAPVLMIDGPSTPSQRAELNGYLARIWRQAAPEGFKVAVALVIVREGANRAGPDAPNFERNTAPIYVFPDSAHRDMCVAVLPERYSFGLRFFDPRRAPGAEPDLDQTLRWLEEGMGPCAFYGAYGIPGREIGRWMNGQGFQLAMYPRWWSEETPWGGFLFFGDRPTSRLPVDWWVSQYSWLPWDGVACYGGRRQQCAADVFDSTAVSDSQPKAWNATEWWRGQHFYSAMTYLSDLSRSLGPARFSQLWGGDVAMDSAVYLATGQTLGDWTLAWARRTGPTIHVGPSAPPLDVGLGLLPALLAFGAALWYSRRRQIG